MVFILIFFTVRRARFTPSERPRTPAFYPSLLLIVSVFCFIFVRPQNHANVRTTADDRREEQRQTVGDTGHGRSLLPNGHCRAGHRFGRKSEIGRSQTKYVNDIFFFFFQLPFHETFKMFKKFAPVRGGGGLLKKLKSWHYNLKKKKNTTKKSKKRRSNNFWPPPSSAITPLIIVPSPGAFSLDFTRFRNLSEVRLK